MKSSYLKNDDSLWVCLVNSEHIQGSVLGSSGSREHASPNGLRH